MPTPTVTTHLPDLMPFAQQLADDYTAGKFDGWESFGARVKAFFTPERMEEIEKILPGWTEMASYRDGVTLVHITAALAALLLLPEYQQASPDDQNLMQWIVLFHDLTKKLIPGQKDHTHAFRSAAVAGRQLPKLSFPLNDGFAPDLAPWANFTLAATVPHPETGQLIQDNRKLPDILAGIDRLFSTDTPATLIIKTVLLHMSISNLADWPQAAPLTDAEIAQVVDHRVLPLLKMMMLVDNDAWMLFDLDTKASYRTETLEVFERITPLIPGAAGVL